MPNKNTAKKEKSENKNVTKASTLNDFLKAKQNQRTNNSFGVGSFGKSARGAKPQIWNRKNGM